MSSLASVVELGFSLRFRRERASEATRILEGHLRERPWLRVADVEPDRDATVVYLGAALGSPSAVKNAEPEVQMVLGDLIDLVDDLTAFDIAFAAIDERFAPVPERVHAGAA